MYAGGNVARAYPLTFQQRFGAAYRIELQDFVRCVVADREPSVTGDDGVRAMEIALAATRSQRERCVVGV